VLKVHDKLKFAGHRFQRVVRVDILCAPELEVNAGESGWKKKGDAKGCVPRTTWDSLFLWDEVSCLAKIHRRVFSTRGTGHL